MKADHLSLMAAHLGCKADELSIPRCFHCGMLQVSFKSQMYAVGAPGFTENYYGSEIKLCETLSAYRLTPENPYDKELDYK